jgi:dTDP-glucose 4,6-dehydratase
MNKNIIFVTGGLGFIGKHFITKCLELGHFIINIDAIKYSSDRFINEKFKQYENYKFIHCDIVDLAYLPECDFIVNFAAESHVDNSISSNKEFCKSNIMGVQRLLELVRAKNLMERPKFIQISTDEVYGDIISGQHLETDLLNPSNPYSATKASADMLVIGWGRTYNINFNIIRMTNNYGSNQYPEKLIPKSILRLKRGKAALLHGDGSYIRSWLHVNDSINAILSVMEKGNNKEIYNVHGNLELKNIEVINKIIKLMNIKFSPPYYFIDNRVGQDIRYSLNDNKIRALGWQPIENFDIQLNKIINSDSYERFL